MLGAGGKACCIAEAFALKTSHYSHSHCAAQVRVFAARTLCYASPAGIARNVEHRRERPVYAVGRGFGCCYACAFLNELRIERGSLSQWDWEDGLITMNHVAAHHKRYAKT